MKLLLSFFLLLSSFSLQAGMMNFTVSPAIVKFETVQGSVKAFDLNFFNQGKNPLQVKVEAMDLTLDTHGVPVVSEASKKPNQWARYIELSKHNFKVSAGESKSVHVTLKTPRGKLGGGYFAVSFNATEIKTNKKSKPGQNSMRIGGQLPSLFIGEISRTGTHKAQVVDAKINQAPYTDTHPLKLRYLLKNTGTTHINVSGDILLRDGKKVLDRVRLNSGSGLILPGGSRYFTATWTKADKHANSKILAEARFSYSGGRLTKKLTFTTP